MFTGYGANVTIVQFLFLAILPATLGNVVGGSLGMGTVYWYLQDDTASWTLLNSRLSDSFNPKRW